MQKDEKLETSLKVKLILIGFLFFGCLAFLALIFQFFNDSDDIIEISKAIFITEKVILASIHLQRIQMFSTHILVNCVEPLDYMPADVSFQELQESMNAIIDCEKMITSVLTTMNNSAIQQYFVGYLFTAKITTFETKVSMFQLIRFFISNSYILSQSEMCSFSYKSNAFLDIFTYNLYNYYDKHFQLVLNTIKEETLKMTGSKSFISTSIGLIVCVLGMVIFSIAYILVTEKEKIMLVNLFVHLFPSQIQVILYKIDNFLKEMANAEIDISLQNIKETPEIEFSESKRKRENVKIWQKLKPVAYFICLPLLVFALSSVSLDNIRTIAKLGQEAQNEISWSLSNYFNYAQLYNINLLNFVNSSLTINSKDVPTFLNDSYNSVYVLQSSLFESQFEQVDFSSDYFAFTSDFLFDNLTSTVLYQSLPDEDNTIISDQNVIKVLNLTENPGLVPLISGGLANFHLQIQKILDKMRGAALFMDDVDRMLETFGSPECKNSKKSRFCVFQSDDFKVTSQALVILYFKIVLTWIKVIEKEFNSNVIGSMISIRIRHFCIMVGIISVFIAIFVFFTRQQVSKESKSIKSILGMVVYENLGCVDTQSIENKENLKMH